MRSTYYIFIRSLRWLKELYVAIEISNVFDLNLIQKVEYHTKARYFAGQIAMRWSFLQFDKPFSKTGKIKISYVLVLYTHTLLNSFRLILNVKDAIKGAALPLLISSREVPYGKKSK